MAIPINGIHSSHSGSTQGRNIDKNAQASQAGRQNIDKPGTPPQSSAKGESVSLSSQAQSLKKIEQDLKAQPEVNESRVAEIKAQVESGTYKIDNEKLAQNMLDLEGTLF